MKYYIYQGIGSDGELKKVAEVTDKKRIHGNRLNC